jgi:hypothetical protein
MRGAPMSGSEWVGRSVAKGTDIMLKRVEALII